MQQLFRLHVGDVWQIFHRRSLRCLCIGGFWDRREPRARPAVDGRAEAREESGCRYVQCCTRINPEVKQERAYSYKSIGLRVRAVPCGAVQMVLLITTDMAEVTPQPPQPNY